MNRAGTLAYFKIPIILAFLVFLLSACTSSTLKPLPTSTIEVENTSSSIKLPPAKILTYLWNSESEYSKTSALGIEYEPQVVPANSVLKISFDRQPESYGMLDEIYGDDISNAKRIDNYTNGIKVPSKPGVYTYSYYAAWDEGNALYVFKIKVE
jgi:hypothetical protein